MLLLLWRSVGDSGLRLGLRHNVLAVSDCQLPLPLPGVVRLTHALLVAAATAVRSPRPVVRLLLSLIIHHSFSVFEHFLSP